MERQHGHWVGNGVVDFNRLTIGPPLADLPRFWHVVRAWPSASIETFMAASGLRDRAASVTSLAREALAWALVQRQHRAWSIDGLEDVRSLDELAELAFARVIEGR